jgi:hypothetical protein
VATTIFPNQDFENGFGSIFIDGGGDAQEVTYSSQSSFILTSRPSDFPGNGGGSYLIRLRDNDGVASSMYTNTMSVAGYNTLRLEFDYYVSSFEPGETFYVEWKTPSGPWVIENQWLDGISIQEDVWTRAIVAFDDWAVSKPSNIAIRIRSHASDNTDRVFIDNVIFYGIN